MNRSRDRAVAVVISFIAVVITGVLVSSDQQRTMARNSRNSRNPREFHIIAQYNTTQKVFYLNEFRTKNINVLENASMTIINGNLEELLFFVLEPRFAVIYETTKISLKRKSTHDDPHKVDMNMLRYAVNLRQTYEKIQKLL